VKNWKRLALLLPLLILIISLTWVTKKELPKIKRAIITLIQHEIKLNSPFLAKIENLSFSLLPMGVTFHNLSLSPKTIPAKGLPSLIQLAQGRVEIEILYLLRGQVRINEIRLDALELSMTLEDKSEDPMPTLDLAPLFKLTPFVDKTRLVIQNSSVKLSNIQGAFDLNLHQIDLLLAIEKSQIQAWLQLPKIEALSDNQHFYFSANTQVTLEETRLNVTSLEISNPEIKLSSSFLATDIKNFLLNPSLSGSVSAQFASNEKSSILQQLGFNVKGQLIAVSNFKIENNRISSDSTKVRTQNFQINQFRVGQFLIDSKISSTESFAEVITLKDRNINIELQNTAIEYLPDQPLSLKSKVIVHELQIQDLLKNLGMTKVPVWLNLRGDGNCEGALYPQLKLNCQANFNGQDLDVRASYTESNPILKIDQFHTKGSVQVTNDSVKYDAKINLHNLASGTSNGQISFKNGFQIQFSGNDLDFKKIGKVAGLKLEGLANLKGQTQGNSQSATFELSAITKNLKFENLGLGNASSNLTYKSGTLTFESLKTTIGNSTVNGLLKLNLLQSEIQLDLATKKISGEDAMTLFGFYLPEGLISQGDGSLRFSIRGPFNWRKWNTQLDLKFSKPLIFNEYFDEVKIQFITQDQFINFGSSYASKGPHRIVLSGAGHLEKNSEINITAANMPLEYIDNISLLNASLSGVLNFKGKLINPFGAVNWTNEVEFSQLLLNEQKLEDIEVTYVDTLANRFVSFLYGNQVLKAELNLKKQADAVSELIVLAQNFDARPLFTLIGSSALVEDYESRTSLNFNYQFTQAEPLRGSGRLSITDFSVSRLGTALGLKTPVAFQISEGDVAFSNMELIGSMEQTMELAAEGSLYENLRLSLKSDAELQLFHPFVPFFDDFRGRLQGNIQVHGIPNDPKAFGQLRVSKGQLQFKGLPQALSQIQLQSEFKGNELEILSFSSEVGQGLVHAKGKIRYHDVGDIQLEIPISIKNVMLEPSEGIRVKSSGQIAIKGSWFPYQIEGSVDLLEGLISRDFEGSDSVLVRRSSLLPKIILKKAFDPVSLNVHIKALPIQLRNALIEGFASGQIQILGSPAQPKLKGEIRVQENARIFFREHEFRLDQGVITLDGGADLNPGLLFSALTRIDRFDVTLNVHGTVNAPIIRLSSQPLLPEPDLISLLALGQVTTDVERRLQTPSSQAQAEAQIGSVLLQNIPLLKKAQKAAGVNVLISSGFDPEQNAEFRRISVSKRLNNNTRVVAATGDYGFREFSLEYLLTDNLSAIGRFKQQDFIPNSIDLQRQNRADSILGLDLEFRREFR